MNPQNTQQTQKGSGIKTMPVRFSVAILSASLVLFAAASASAQSWPPRLISRTGDVSQISKVDAVEWFSGEQITYQRRGYSGNVTNYAQLPTNAVGIWFATDETYTNYFIVWTNSAQSNATGFMEFVLPTPFSALTAKTYQSWVNIYGGTPTNGSTPIAVFDRMEIKVKRGASYAGTYRGPITYTNVTLDGSTYVAPGFWTLHADDISAVVSGLVPVMATTTAAFFEVYATNYYLNVGTNVGVWTVVAMPGTGAVFGFTITNGAAYCQTPGIYSVDAFGQLDKDANPGEYRWAIFNGDSLLVEAEYDGNPAPSYKDVKLGGLIALTNGSVLTTRMIATDADPNPTHAIFFKRSVLRAVSTVSALASNVTVNIGGGSGTSTNVIFENLDNNGDVGGGTNQVARGSDLAAKADSNIVYTALAAKADSNTVYTAIASKATSNTVYAALAAKADSSTVYSAISAKADSNIVYTAIAAKADSNTVYSAFAAADAQLAGLWQSNRITFAGTTISNVCGWSLNIVYGTNVNSMQSTGCVAYLNIADTNGPAGGAAATNTQQNVASFPLYNKDSWTGEYSIVESGSTFGQDMTLVLWECRVSGGTQTVDLLDFATTGAFTTNTAALLVVGYTSVVPSVTTLSAGHHLGVQLRPGATWTNRLIGGVRGRP